MKKTIIKIIGKVALVWQELDGLNKLLAQGDSAAQSYMIIKEGENFELSHPAEGDFDGCSISSHGSLEEAKTAAAIDIAEVKHLEACGYRQRFNANRDACPNSSPIAIVEEWMPQYIDGDYYTNGAWIVIEKELEPCGLNAEWCVQAWSFSDPHAYHEARTRHGYSHRSIGDIFLLDNEDGTFSLVRKFAGKEDADGNSDTITSLGVFDAFIDGIERGEKLAAQEGTARKSTTLLDCDGNEMEGNATNLVHHGLGSYKVTIGEDKTPSKQGTFEPINEAVSAIEARLDYYQDAPLDNLETITELMSALDWIIIGLDVALDQDLVEPKKGKKDIADATQVVAKYKHLLEDDPDSLPKFITDPYGEEGGAA